MLWVIAAALFVVWGIMVSLGKGGLVHILILNAIAIAVVKFMAVRRARPDATGGTAREDVASA